MSAPVGRWLLIGAGVAVAATVAAAIAVMGGPGAQRAMRLDERRVHDLDNIEDEVRGYWSRHQRLPADLSVLAKQPGVALTTTDPASAQAYGYRGGEAGRYRLCARFATDTGADANKLDGGLPWSSSRWRHPAGEFCYDLDASKPES